MIKLKQFAELKVERLNLQFGQHVHVHEYYEFVLISSGKGKHHVHDTIIDFNSGDVFFLNPGTAHFFEVEEPGAGIVVRYNEYIKSVLKTLISSWDGYAIPLSKAKSPLNPKIHLAKADQFIVTELFNLLALLGQNVQRNENLIFHQMVSLISVMERNLSFEQKSTDEQLKIDNTQRILRHIHKNMKNPELLTRKYLAKEFNIPLSYIGIYFKRNTKVSLKDYIRDCRMKIIGRKIKNSALSISEIAFQFGYTDESHFYKAFKQFFGISPSAYRKP